MKFFEIIGIIILIGSYTEILNNGSAWFYLMACFGIVLMLDLKEQREARK